jgi:hypothetical protein
MYYPQSQITSNLYTNGNEFSIKGANSSYIGDYWKVSSGKYYTGKNPQDTPNQELVRFTSDRSQIVSDPAIAVSEIALAYDSPYVFNENLYNENEILTYLNLKKKSIAKYPIIIPTYSATLPTQNDYQIGEFRRYFCKKTNEIIYLEISKETYNKLVAQDPKIDFSLYIPFNLPWQLTGNKEQVYKTNKNITELTSTRQKLPMLSKYLKMDFTKYYK